MNHRKLFFNLIVLFTLPLVSLLGSLVLTGLAQAAPVAATGIEGAKLTFPETSPANIPLLQGSPILTITKIAASDPVDAGSVLAYTISVVNGSATATATDVIITDTLDSNVSFASASDGGQPSAGFVTWNVGVITTGATITRTLLVTVGDVMSGTILSNTAVVTSTEGISDSETITTTVTTAADLVISKSDSPDPVIAGEMLTYTLTITNNGPSSAQNVAVTDTLPLSVSLVSVSPPTSTQSGQILEWNFGNLIQGDTQAITIVVTVGGNVRGTITNTAVVTTSTTDPTPNNNSDTELTTINTRANLILTKTDSPDPAITTLALDYTLIVTNSGPSNATGVVLTDTLPAGIVFDTAPLACSHLSGTVTCNLGTIAVGSNAQVIITTHPIAAGVFTNTATVTAIEPDPDTTNNTDTENTTVNPADLSLTKTDSPDPVLVGNPLTYTLTIENDGPDQANVAVLTDTLPSGVTFKSATGVGASCTQMSGTVTCNLGNIASGGNRIVTIVVTPTVTGVITNTASVISNNPDPNSANNTTSITTTVDPVANLSIAKSAAPDPVTAGTGLTYTLTIINSGPSTATGVIITDTLPASVTFASASLGCSNSGNMVTCNLADIVSSGIATVSIQVTVNPSAAGVLTNTVSVAGNEADLNMNNNSATITTTVNRMVDLSITKSDLPDPVAAGSSLTYTLTVTNSGPSIATGVVVTDTLPAGVTLVSAPGCSGTSITTCNLSPINSGDNAIVTIVVDVPDAATGVLSNTASVSSSEIDSNSANNTTTITTTVNRVTDLAITKIDTPDPVTQGNNLTYNLTVTNNGPSNATGVSVTDTLPAGVTFISAVPSQGSCSGTTTITCNLGSLAKNASATITITVNVSLTTPPGNITNTATVSGGGGLDNPPNNSATATTLVTILYKTYLPVVLKDFPVTDLSVFNDNTGGNVIFTVLGTSVSCTVPDNTLQFCGSFPSGTYNVKVTSACPNGGNITIPIAFDGGPVTKRVFCN
jgi:uncharacterized repeat protein (TIGR01451 family)